MSYRTYFKIGDQKLTIGIYMPTAIFNKTSSGALRTFKRFGASCYSGVPEFRPDPAQTVRTSDIQVFGFRRVA
jgi:hypothetical protein